MVGEVERASDKYIVKNPGYLQHHPLTGPARFDLADSVSLCMEQLWIYRPAFTRGCDQLSAEGVEAMRKIANVGIHVEQIIGAVCQHFQISSVVL